MFFEAVINTHFKMRKRIELWFTLDYKVDGRSTCDLNSSLLTSQVLLFLLKLM